MQPPALATPAPQDYRCPACGDSAPVPVLCDRCDRAMVPADELPAIAVDAIRPRRLDPTRAWLTTGALLGACCSLWPGFHLGACVLYAPVFEVWRGTALWPLVLALVTTAVAIVSGLLGRYAASVRLREGRRRALAREASARIDALPRRDLTALDEGPARVVGRVRRVAPVYSAAGVPCVAFEALAAGEAARAPRQSVGTVFELEDLAGTRAWVRAEPVIVAAGLEFDEHAHVPAGALIELAGTARRAVARDASGARGAPFRGAAEALEIVGTRAHPVVLRVLAA